MESWQPGDQVNVAAAGGASHGIVFDTPSRAKVVVAVVDPDRGPGFRTVHPRDLAERTEAGPDDPALRLLIRRTSPPAHGGGSGAVGVGHTRAGHVRGSMHRTTGR